jgi:phosphopantetheinyl transferase (holo-ACP synthase)
MQAISACENKARLLAEYQAAKEAYLKAVSELLRSVGTTTRMEFERLNLLVEHASIACAEAIKDLDLHTYQHGC